MVCPKCNAQLDDDSRFCKACGAAAMDIAAHKRTKKQYIFGVLLPGAICLIMLLCGLILGLQCPEPYDTIGFVLVGASLAILACAGVFAFSTALSKVFQARADKEAARDKLLWDILKKLEDLEHSQEQ